MTADINLLFATNENYILWKADDSDYKEIVSDLTVEELVIYLKKMKNDFPAEYLYKPCFKIEDAIHRHEVMEELLCDNDLLEFSSDFILKMKVIAKLLTDYFDERNEWQKRIKFLRVVSEFSKCIMEGATKLELSKSCALSKLGRYCKEEVVRYHINEMRDDVELHIEAINSALTGNSLMFDRRAGVFTLRRENVSIGNFSTLKRDIVNVFGININDSFSIVDSSPFGQFEDRLLQIYVEDNPGIFSDISNFSDENQNILQLIQKFCNLYDQLVFYVVYVSFIKHIAHNGLVCCRPMFCETLYQAQKCVPPALVARRLNEGGGLTDIVENDIFLPKSGIVVISGKNQGGKTTYLKMLGLTAFLAKCGCYVMSEYCDVPFYGNIFTHFIRREKMGKSRLVYEVERLERILEKSSGETLVLLNESFTTTRRKDGLELATHYLERLIDRECSVGFVTFYYEISSINDILAQVAITLSSVEKPNASEMYKLVPQPPNNRANAYDIARKCGMTFEQLKSEIVRLCR